MVLLDGISMYTSKHGHNLLTCWVGVTGSNFLHEGEARFASRLTDPARRLLGTLRSLEPILLNLMEELDIALRKPVDFLPLLSGVSVTSAVLFSLTMLSSSDEGPFEHVSRSSSLENFKESILETDRSLEKLRTGSSQVVESRGKCFQRLGLIFSSTDPCRP